MRLVLFPMKRLVGNERLAFIGNGLQKYLIDLFVSSFRAGEKESPISGRNEAPLCEHRKTISLQVDRIVR